METLEAIIKQAAVSSSMKWRVPGICLSISAFLCTARGATAQRIVVDAAPSQAVNSFSPFRALGAGVDRLSTGSTDTLLSPPVLQEVLSAGWQSVT